ncbi:translation initiation factor IF-5A [Streptomyces anulatus]|uniref:translation initiation factor IF-5A n=1 Tax=Streptomyces anulatus TaxID=1892 RepID=UPI00340CD03E
MSDTDFEFDSVDAETSATFPRQASALRKNDYVVIKGRPCKIVDMSSSKAGKNGHVRVNIAGIDIFTGKKYEDMSPSTHNMEVPNVKRAEFQLSGIDGGLLSLMDASGNTKDDVKLPAGDLGESIQAQFDEGKALLVTVLAAMGEEAVVAFEAATGD